MIMCGLVIIVLVPIVIWIHFSLINENGWQTKLILIINKTLTQSNYMPSYHGFILKGLWLLLVQKGVFFQLLNNNELISLNLIFEINSIMYKRFLFYILIIVIKTQLHKTNTVNQNLDVLL
jgi:hypothetical protein